MTAQALDSMENKNVLAKLTQAPAKQGWVGFISSLSNWPTHHGKVFSLAEVQAEAMLGCQAY